MAGASTAQSAGGAGVVAAAGVLRWTARLGLRGKIRMGKAYLGEGGEIAGMQDCGNAGMQECEMAEVGGERREKAED